MVHLSVVIPVYNESSLIEELVKRVKTNVKLITDDYEIIIVDDGSQDNTWNSIEVEAKSEKRAEKKQERDSRYRPVARQALEEEDLMRQADE